MFQMGKILPHLTQIGNYLKLGIDHYADLRAAGKAAGPDLVALYLEEKMKAWDPIVNDKKLLDPETRKAAARFLAGLAINLSG